MPKTIHPHCLRSVWTGVFLLLSEKIIPVIIKELQLFLTDINIYINFYMNYSVYLQSQNETTKKTWQHQSK
jgi:hypothetical protein